MRMWIAIVVAATGSAAAEPRPKAAIPCFPQATKPLVAGEIYKKLEKHVWSLYESDEEKPPMTATFGTCKLVRNTITAADGSLVGELGCGMRVTKRGIVDGLGVQVGMLGKDVIARKPKPLGELRCVANGEAQTRCQFADGAYARTSVDAHPDAYVVAGDLGSAAILMGDEALAFFRTRELVELHVSFWCH